MVLLGHILVIPTHCQHMCSLRIDIGVRAVEGIYCQISNPDNGLILKNKKKLKNSLLTSVTADSSCNCRLRRKPASGSQFCETQVPSNITNTQIHNFVCVFFVCHIHILRQFVLYIHFACFTKLIF